jgi:parvulin-like peptidyl-prolyl isomerase
MTLQRPRLSAGLFAVTALLSPLLIGCSHDGKPGPLAPQFATVPRTQKEFASDPLSGADQPGALYRNPRSDQLQPEGPGGATDNTLSETVQKNVTAPGSRGDVSVTDNAGASATTATTATAAATTGPVTPGVSTGQFLTIGGVVADVNSTPIYANKVLTQIEPVLAARAKELDPVQFKTEAAREIRNQIRDLVREQLEYAAAERNLDQKDKDLADFLTEQWRDRQATAAGGSIELAKKLAKERGRDFDELMQDQYRLIMSRIYLDRKVVPRIVVNAADMRAYYDSKREEEFTDRGVAQFRLIKIDVRKHDGREKALQLAGELRNRIVKAGERFEAIARSVNDDPRLLKSGGEVGKIDEGAFKIEPVDKAVWATPDGQVTPVIDTGDALYLALVEEKKPGRVLPFEDEAVQARINKRLTDIQFNEARERVYQQLINDAVIRQDKNMVDIAVDMAMQSYPRWAAK